MCGVSSDPEGLYCGACGSALTRAAAVGERRQLTVLFCDLVGSTALAGQLDPEDWREVVAEYQRATAETVTRFGGHVAQYLGDGLLVYFGYPAAHEDDAERAVRAGLCLLDTVAQLNQRIEPIRRVRLAVRVGMHTGPVVIGGGAVPGADVFGDTPNVAARVQTLADPDTVFITEATHRLVSGRFVVEARGTPPLKGVREPVAVYRVVQPSTVRSRFAAASLRGLTPLVGRELERRLLAERWAQAKASKGQVVLITGEAGIGKSRLVETFKETLAAEPHTWFESAGSPYQQNTPFYAVIDMLRQALGWRDDRGVAGHLDAVERSLARSGMPVAEAVPLVAPLLGLPIPERYRPLGLSPEAQRRRTLSTLAAWLLGAACVQPVVLVIEDLHWVDPSTLELQGFLGEQLMTARVLILLTARPEFKAPWPLLAHHMQITLNRLSGHQVREMIGHVAGRNRLSAELTETLVARADGVPLFVEELTRAVMEGHGGAERGVPGTLHDSLIARLDRLGAAKEVAQVGAVLGREFSYGLLHTISPLAERELQAALQQLADAELIYLRGRPPEASYVFKHALVQEVAYQSLLKRRRRELHGAVARALEERFSETAVSEPEVVARHAEAAGLTDKAVVYYQRAGERVQGRSAHEEAITQFRKAIMLLGTLPADSERDAREASLQMALGASLMAARGFAHAETEAAHERARVLCEAARNAATLASTLSALSNLYANRGEPDRSVILAERVIAVGEETRNRTLILSAHGSAALAKHYQGLFAPSLIHCERVIALYDPAYDRAAALEFGNDVGVGALGIAAWNLWYLGRPDLALGRARQGVALARTLDPFSLAFALFFEASVHRLRCDWREQRERAAEVVVLGDVHDFPLWRGLGRMLHGLARIMSGEGAADLAEVTEGLALAAGTGNRGGVPALLYALADGQRAAGQHDEALSTVESGLDVAATSGQHFFDAPLRHLKGELLLATNPANIHEAEALFRRAIEIARGQEARSVELRAATSLARLLRSQGKGAEARALLAPVYEWFTEGFGTRDLVEAKELLDEL